MDQNEYILRTRINIFCKKGKICDLNSFLIILILWCCFLIGGPIKMDIRFKGKMIGNQVDYGE